MAVWRADALLRVYRGRCKRASQYQDAERRSVRRVREVEEAKYATQDGCGFVVRTMQTQIPAGMTTIKTVDLKWVF